MRAISRPTFFLDHGTLRVLIFGRTAAGHSEFSHRNHCITTPTASERSVRVSEDELADTLGRSSLPVQPISSVENKPSETHRPSPARPGPAGLAAVLVPPSTANRSAAPGHLTAVASPVNDRQSGASRGTRIVVV